MEFEPPEANPAHRNAAIAAMIAGAIHLFATFVRGAFYSVVMLMILFDPSIGDDWIVFVGAFTCMALPEIGSFVLGALLIVVGNHSRTDFKKTTLIALGALSLVWLFVRIAMDMLTCSCMSMPLHVMPMMASIVCIALAANIEE